MYGDQTKMPKAFEDAYQGLDKRFFTSQSILEGISLIYAQCIYPLRKKNLISKVYLLYLILCCVSGYVANFRLGASMKKSVR